MNSPKPMPNDPIAEALRLIGEMLKVCEGATPGPWFVPATLPTIVETEDRRIVAGCSTEALSARGIRDAQFIRAARTFGPAALELAKGMLEQGHAQVCARNHWTPGECDCIPGKLAAEFRAKVKGEGEHEN